MRLLSLRLFSLLSPPAWWLWWRRLSPPALIVTSFAALIAVGTAGLMWIPGLQAGPPLSFLDALFTMTSAVCVTGLIVVDTATHFTRSGQLWLLVFIQLGGLGVITLTTMLIGALGRRLSLRTETIAMPLVSSADTDLGKLAVAVGKFTLAAEAAGALALFLLWLPRFDVADAAWHAVFHAVSAFCNAGFSTFSDSLVGFADSPLTLLVVSALVVAGGIGFLSVWELRHWWRGRRALAPSLRTRVRGPRLSSHTATVVVTTAVLLGVGWIAFTVFEWNNVLADMSVVDKLANGLFMAVTPRTAGFNSISYAQVGNDTAMLTIVLMFIGGSPGSTAGGTKTTTIAVLIALAWSRMRGRRYVELRGRGIPQGTIDRTVSLLLMAMTVITAALLLLNFIRAAHIPPAKARGEFLAIVFEATSAFGTVGLSMDLTASLWSTARVILICLMFIGRVGLLSFFSALTLRSRLPSRVRPAHEDLLIG
ncbi:MAG: potassium transporter Trk [Deltaproteobacteria bacterium]|nr:MAG: potassium transporter Trk [Deltaproteobacteria bacterium]